jgi:hypothetical protein
MEGYWPSLEVVRQLVRIGAGDVESNLRVAQTDPFRPNDSRVFGGNLGPLDSRTGYRFHGGSQQPVLVCEAQGPRIPDGGIHDHPGLYRRRENHPTASLTH